MRRKILAAVFALLLSVGVARAGSASAFAGGRLVNLCGSGGDLRVEAGPGNTFTLSRCRSAFVSSFYVRTRVMLQLPSGDLQTYGPGWHAEPPGTSRALSVS
jgi:hypothetical protein